MSEEEKKLKAKEQSESLADSKKIDLYINNEKDDEQGRNTSSSQPRP